MKIKPGFEVVDIAGENVVVPTGEKVASFNGVVAVSDAAAFLLRCMDTQKSKEDLIELLTGEYDVDSTVAAVDIDSLLKSLFEMGVIEE